MVHKPGRTSFLCFKILLSKISSFQWEILAERCLSGAREGYCCSSGTAARARMIFCKSEVKWQIISLAVSLQCRRLDKAWRDISLLWPSPRSWLGLEGTLRLQHELEYCWGGAWAHGDTSSFSISVCRTLLKLVGISSNLSSACVQFERLPPFKWKSKTISL